MFEDEIQELSLDIKAIRSLSLSHTLTLSLSLSLSLSLLTRKHDLKTFLLRPTHKKPFQHNVGTMRSRDHKLNS